MSSSPKPETLPPGEHVSTADAGPQIDLATAVSPTQELEKKKKKKKKKNTKTVSRVASTTSCGDLATDSGSNEMPSTVAADEKPRSHASPSGSSPQSSARGSQNGESSRRQSWMSGASANDSQASLRGDPRLRMVIRQRRESQNLRELGEFLRSKTPPPTNYMSRDDGSASTSSLPDLAGKKHKFSLKTVLTRKQTRESKGKEVAQPLQQIKLPDTAVAGRTAAGHRHIAISIPLEHSHLGPEIKSQYPIIERENAPSRYKQQPIESFYMEQDELLTNSVLRPVVEVSGESDENENEPDLINTSQTSSPSSPCTPRTAATSQSYDFSRVPPKHSDISNLGDRTPSSDVYRTSISEYPLESWASTETPMSELFVTAPNSLKSVPSSPFETHFPQRSGINTNGFTVQPLSAMKNVVVAEYPCENPLKIQGNAQDVEDDMGASAPQHVTDQSASNQLAAAIHWQPDLNSPRSTAIYTPPEHPGDIVHDKDTFDPSEARGRRLRHISCTATEPDTTGELIPASPTSQKTITPHNSIDNVFQRPISPGEILLKEQDSGLGISLGSSPKQSPARKALAPIKIAADFDMGEAGVEPDTFDDDKTAPEPRDSTMRRGYRGSQVLHPSQSTPTPWSTNVEKQPSRLEQDVESLLSPLPEDILSTWGKTKSLAVIRQEPTPPESPENAAGQALDKDTRQPPLEHKFKPRPPQRAETPQTRPLPQHDRISLSRRIERRKKLAAAAAGANQATLFASIAEAEEKAKALKEKESSRGRRNRMLDSGSSPATPSEMSRSTTDPESAHQRVAEMERRVRQLEQQLEQSGEAWMGALMPLLATLNMTLEGQRAQQDNLAAESLRRQRRRSSASDFGWGWSRYDESAEEAATSRRRNSLRGYLPERDDEDAHLFVSRKAASPAPSRQYRVLTPMDGEEPGDAAQASLQRMRGMRRMSLGSTSNGGYYGNGRKASTASQDMEEDYDCGPRRGFGGDAHWRGFDRFGQPLVGHRRFPSTSTIATESAGSVEWSPGHSGRRQQANSSRRVSFASSTELDPNRDGKKKHKSRRRDSVGGAIDVGRKADDLYGLGMLMDELRDGARVSGEFLPESTLVPDDY